MTEIQKKLFEMQDLSYKEFHSKLMPTVPCEKVIGIRTPILRKYAKELLGMVESEEFMSHLPHEYYEENNLHAFLVCCIRDFDKALVETVKFVPYIDNWATCDSFVPPVFRKNKEKLFPHIENWIASGKTYSVRYGVGLLLNLYLDDAFDKKYLEIVCNIKSDEYYVNMMRAWFFATALAKQYDSAIVYVEKGKLDTWTHNKTIQKCIESYRISDEIKAYLRTLKIKN